MEIKKSERKIFTDVVEALKQTSDGVRILQGEKEWVNFNQSLRYFFVKLVQIDSNYNTLIEEVTNEQKPQQK